MKEFLEKAKISKKALVTYCISLAVIVVASVGIYAYCESRVYALTLDGEPICYLAGEKQADKFREKMFEKFCYEGSELKAYDTEGDLDLEPVNGSVAEDKIVKVDDALGVVDQKIADGKLKITVASAITEETTYTPTPKYIKDDTMIAGDSEVVKEGVDGTQKLSTTYTTVNGELMGQGVTNTEILDKGKRATVKKGTLGLPDGEDWKTYEGDPVYKDGKEVVALAKKYTGLRYIYGGKDLTKGVSCIGLVVAIYEKMGIKLPMHNTRIRTVGVEVSYDAMQPGDIICYEGHVALYAGNGKIIDTRHGTTVQERPLNSVGRKYLTTRRIVVE